MDMVQCLLVLVSIPGGDYETGFLGEQDRDPDHPYRNSGNPLDIAQIATKEVQRKIAI
ncbi:hypothetical protein [Paracidovorax valerianellae]|uniref:hypothetical protein n=1 Tax=Paracidovorax valerianellae TaxID=187868 RepID=UPI0023020ED7|nr:hypothetical protein [Paracidovorax valerianellae]MDA8444406.1 hypothetical protein [Paracidovorax valerianellae]